MKDYVTQEEIM